MQTVTIILMVVKRELVMCLPSLRLGFNITTARNHPLFSNQHAVLYVDDQPSYPVICHGWKAPGHASTSMVIGASKENEQQKYEGR